ELRALVFLVILDQLMDAAAGEIEEVDLSGGVLAPAHDAVRGAGQLVARPEHRLLQEFGAFVGLDADVLGETLLERPDPACIEIAIDVLPFELAEPLAVVNKPAGNRAKRLVPMLYNRREDRRRSPLAFGPEGMRSLLHRPAVVAALFDLVDHLPQV